MKIIRNKLGSAAKLKAAGHPSWSDTLGLLGQGTEAESMRAAQVSGSWHKLIADLIVGKR